MILAWWGIALALADPPKMQDPLFLPEATARRVLELRDEPLGTRVKAHSAPWLGLPYTDGPLGEAGGPDPDPVVRYDTFDCLTFVEEVLALSMATDPVNVQAVRMGLADGTIDAIATDHAPHADHSKEQPFDEAPPGMLGLETALSLALEDSGLDLPEILALMSWRPAAIAGVNDRHGLPVVVGNQANLCVIDPDETWTVSGRAMASPSSNTPYEGRTLRGRVRHTIRAGEPVVVDGEARR